jgi:hypothetical protein
MPRERPILFSGPMVRAILAGQKTQTRRPLKAPRVRLRHEVCSDLPAALIHKPMAYKPGLYPATLNPQGAVCAAGPDGELGLKPGEFDFQCPYAAGHTYLRKFPDGRMLWHLQVLEEQRLWVRETWAPHSLRRGRERYLYRATRQEGTGYPATWSSPIFMPRRASRLLLEVAEVRVERLQAITEEDARSEGVTRDSEPCDHHRYSCSEIGCLGPGYRSAYAGLWDELHSHDGYGWSANPWVWVITFRRVTT